MLRDLIRAAGIRQQIATAVGVLAVIAFLVGFFGAAEGAPGLATRVAIAVGLGAATGVPLGLVQALLVGGLTVFASRMGIAAWWAGASSRDRDAPRQPVIGLHAGGLAATVALVLFGGALWVLMPRVLHIDDQGFARGFAVVLLITVLVTTAAGGFVLARLLRPLVSRIDERVGLPWPAAPAARYVLFVAAPVALLLPPYLLRRAEDLGAFAAPFWLIVLFAGEGLVVLLWRSWGPSGKLWTTVSRLAPAIAVVGAAVASLSMNASSEGTRWARRSGPLKPAVGLMSKITDVDRDGFSSLFGGGDCAALDGGISPKAADIPGNGIDEDCAGGDAEVPSRDSLVVFSGAYEVPKQSKKKQPNVIFVIIDAVRADMTGIGGAKKSATPYLDEAAEDSLAFTQAHSQSSATMISIPTMLAGRDPSSADWKRGKRIEFAESERTLGKRLEDLGYRTRIIGTKYLNTHLTRLLDEFQSKKVVKTAKKKTRKAPGGAYYNGRSASLVMQTIRYLEEDLKKPTFVTLYLPEPHAGYMRHGFGLSKFGKTKKGLYKGEIANADRSLGMLVHYLKHTKQWSNTVFIVVADHGEEFGEHGGKAHARTCYVESTHVPLVMHIPGVKGQKIKNPVGLYDIAPTVLEVLGQTDPEALNGQSLLVPALTPEQVPEDRLLPCAVISQTGKQGNFFRRSVRSDGRLLVHNVLEGRYEFYDTDEDPEEKTDLYDARKDDPEVADLRTFLGETQQGNLARTLITD